MGDQRSDCSGDREQGLWRGAGRARGGPGPQERAYLGGRRNRSEKPRRASGQTPQASYCETPSGPPRACGSRPSVSPPDRPQLPSLLWPPVCRDESILIKVSHYLSASLGITKHKRKGPCCVRFPIFQSCFNSSPHSVIRPPPSWHINARWSRLRRKIYWGDETEEHIVFSR